MVHKTKTKIKELSTKGIKKKNIIPIGPGIDTLKALGFFV